MLALSIEADITTSHNSITTPSVYCGFHDINISHQLRNKIRQDARFISVPVSH